VPLVLDLRHRRLSVQLRLVIWQSRQHGELAACSAGVGRNRRKPGGYADRTPGEIVQVSALMNPSAPSSVVLHSAIHRPNPGHENAVAGCNAFVMLTG
jgi:hypothetical protein